MKAIAGVCLAVFVLHGGAIAQVAPQSESGSRRDLGRQLIATTGGVQAAIQSIRNTLEARFPSHAKTVLREIWSTEGWEWEALEEGLAAAYAEAFSEEELRTLLTFFQSDLGQKWSRGVSTMLDRVSGTIEREQTKKFAEVGCSLGFILKTVDIFEAQTRAAGQGVSPDEIVRRMKPVFPAIGKFCSCVMGKAADKWGYGQLQAAQATPEFQGWVRHLIQTGECVPPERAIQEFLKRE